MVHAEAAERRGAHDVQEEELDDFGQGDEGWKRYAAARVQEAVVS